MIAAIPDYPPLLAAISLIVGSIAFGAGHAVGWAHGRWSRRQLVQRRWVRQEHMR